MGPVEFPAILLKLLPALVCAIGFASLVPLIGISGLGLKGRIAIVAYLTLLLASQTVGQIRPQDELLGGVVVSGLGGALIALVLRSVVVAARMVGELTEQQMGVSATGGVDDDDVTSPLGRLFVLSTTVVFFSASGHRVIVGALCEVVSTHATFDAAMADSLRRATDVAWFGIVVGAQLSLPVLLSLVVSNIGVGMISRAIPQFTSTMATTPILLGTGLVLVLVSFPSITTRLIERLEWAMRL